LTPLPTDAATRVTDEPTPEPTPVPISASPTADPTPLASKDPTRVTTDAPVTGSPTVATSNAPSVTATTVTPTTATPTVVPTSLTDHGIGTEVCACQPSQFVLSLDFAATCADTTFDASMYSCRDPVASFASVHQITLLEYNKDYALIRDGIVVQGLWGSGDTVEFATVTAETESITDPTQLPAHWELYIDGLTADGVATSKLWSLHFTQECDAYPLVQPNDVLGLTQFTETTAPPTSVCASSPRRRLWRGN